MPYSKLCEPFGPFGRQAAAPGIGRIDVVYGDVVKLAHDAMRQLVQKGMARMGNAGVAVARLTLFIGPRQLVLDLFEVARVRHLLTGRQRCKILQTEADAHALMERSGGTIRDVDGDAKAPIAAANPREIGAVLDFAVGQRVVRCEQ